MSQSQLAKLIGITRNAVSLWESGATQPSTKRLSQLARALNVTVDELVATVADIREHLLEVVIKLYRDNHVQEITVEDVCNAAKISRAEFGLHFTSREALVFEAAWRLRQIAVGELHLQPPKYGALQTRLKYLLMHFFVHDLRNARLVATVQADSWSWPAARERENTRHMLEFHDAVIAVLDDAAERGEIDPGKHRATSGLILSVYTQGLRRAICEKSSSDAAVELIEPQLAIILKGYAVRIVPGLSESDSN